MKRANRIDLYDIVGFISVGALIGCLVYGACLGVAYIPAKKKEGGI